jgi:hypothetical protein
MVAAERVAEAAACDERLPFFAVEVAAFVSNCDGVRAAADVLCGAAFVRRNCWRGVELLFVPSGLVCFELSLKPAQDLLLVV